MKLLHDDQNRRIIFNALEGNYALCLVGNLVQLCYIERETTLREIYHSDTTVSVAHVCCNDNISSNNYVNQFQFVLSKLLLSCQNYVVAKQSNLTHWHPILGWFSQKIDPCLQEALYHVKVI